MGKISDIYDKLNLTLASALTDYVRFSNPYEVDANAFLQLRNGYGVGIGAGSDTSRFVGCQVSWQRDFSITLVRQVMTTQNNLGVREALEKDILEDHDRVMKSFYADQSLGGTAIDSKITGDGGITFIDGDRLKFLSIELTLSVEYSDTYT